MKENEGKHLSYEEMAKQDTFADIWRRVEPLLAEEKYDEARRVVNEELNLLAKAMGGDEHARLLDLREELELSLPRQANWLLNPERPEEKARAERAKVAKLDRLEKQAQEEKKDGPPAKPLGRGERIYKKTWDVPDLDEIKPGLIIEIENDIDHRRERFEVIAAPYINKDGHVFVRVLNMLDNREQEISLADKGLYPFRDDETEFWSPVNRPVRWYQKGDGPAEK